jgi:hypothetical protein
LDGTDIARERKERHTGRALAATGNGSSREALRTATRCLTDGSKTDGSKPTNGIRSQRERKQSGSGKRDGSKTDGNGRKREHYGADEFCGG